MTVLDSNRGHRQLLGNTPYFPAEVIGNGQGACNQYGLNCLVSSGFATANGVTVFPNQIRNQYRGPGFFDSDFTINKNFKLTERMAFGVGRELLQRVQPPELCVAALDTIGIAGNFGQVLHDHRTADRTLRLVLHRSAFGTHHPVPRQAGVLDNSPQNCFSSAALGPPFFVCAVSRVLKASLLPSP